MMNKRKHMPGECVIQLIMVSPKKNEKKKNTNHNLVLQRFQKGSVKLESPNSLSLEGSGRQRTAHLSSGSFQLPVCHYLKSTL